MNLKSFVGNFGTIVFDENSLLLNLVGFTPHWDQRPINAIPADSPGVYKSGTILKLSTEDKLHLNCDTIDGSEINGLGQSILFAFVPD